MIYSKKMFDFHPCFCVTELPKHVEFPKCWKQGRYFRYVIEVTLEAHLRMRAGCQWSQPSNWRLRIFSRHLTSWKGRGAGCGINHRWFHQSYFCNEASTKPKGQGSESFWVSEPMEVLGKWSPGEGMEAPNPFPIPFSYMSLVWLFPSYILFW